MQIVSRWKVVVEFGGIGNPPLTFWIDDNHLANVQRMVSTMVFSESGLTQPVSVKITAVVREDA